MKIFILLPILVLIGCNPTVNRSNDKSDVNRASLYCDSFYHYVELNDETGAMEIARNANYEGEIKRTLARRDSVVGRIVEFSAQEVQTEVTIDSQGERGHATLIYECVYDSARTREVFEVSDKDGVLSIEEYRIGVVLDEQNIKAVIRKDSIEK